MTAAIQKLCSFPTLFALKLVGTNPQHATTLTRRELGAEAGTALVLSSLSKMFFSVGLGKHVTYRRLSPVVGGQMHTAEASFSMAREDAAASKLPEAEAFSGILFT